MTARNAIIKYLEDTVAVLTQDKEYEVISWSHSNGANVSALILDDNGNLYAAQNVQDPGVWEVMRI